MVNPFLLPIFNPFFRKLMKKEDDEEGIDLLIMFLVTIGFALGGILILEYIKTNIIFYVYCVFWFLITVYLMVKEPWKKGEMNKKKTNDELGNNNE